MKTKDKGAMKRAAAVMLTAVIICSIPAAVYEFPAKAEAAAAGAYTVTAEPGAAADAPAAEGENSAGLAVPAVIGETGVDTGANGIRDEDRIIVRIRSLEDYLEVASNCHSDIWSRDKYVILETDLSLKGIAEDEFRIASFGGVFDGGDHQISDMQISGSYAGTGLFGRVTADGEIRRLKVSGAVTPTGIQSRLGGIAGENYGLLDNCTFTGTLNAHSEVGGIAGRNMQSGTIRDCRMQGSVIADSCAGGITGYNEGFVSGCENRAEVNTVYSDVPMTADQLTSTLENILLTGRIRSFDNLSVKSNSGGIAGYTSGVIAECVNEGSIGYEHVGYNTGGIAGYSSGYIRACKNTGSVTGRKDTGGIVGQQQPYMEMDFSGTKLGDLDDALSELDEMVNSALEDAQSYSNDTTARLYNISNYAGLAKENVKIISDETQNRAESAASRINQTSRTMQDTMSTLSSVTTDAGAYAARLQRSAASLDESIVQIVDTLHLDDDKRSRLRSAISRLSGGISKEDMQSLMVQLGDAASISAQTLEEVRKSLADILESMEDILAQDTDDGSLQEIFEEIESDPDFVSTPEYEAFKQACIGTEDSLEALRAELKDLELLDPSSPEDLVKLLNALDEGIDKLNEQARKAASLLEEVDSGTIDEETRERLLRLINGEEETAQLKELDEKLSALLKKIREEMQSGSDAGGKIRESAGKVASNINDMTGAASDIIGLLGDYQDQLSGIGNGSLKAALDDLKNAIAESPQISSRLAGSMDAVAGLDLQISGVSDAVKNAGTGLYDSIGGLMNELNGLNGSLNADTTKGLQSIQGISTQISKIIDLVKSAAEDYVNRDISLEERIVDISDQDIENTTVGRTSQCSNTGEISSDSNAGGIAGMIGVELDIDPEDDIQRIGADTSIDYIFRTKGVIDSSENYGAVSAKNNYAGGIAGHMEMGIATDCVNYGDVNSGGDFAGGIAGYSAAEIRRSMARANISGGSYLGGIAGYGSRIYDCATMITMGSAKQHTGAIAGSVKNIDKEYLSGNSFYSDRLFGIDEVTYDGLAQSITYDDLLAGERGEEVFGSIRIAFQIDERPVSVQTCTYGGSLRQEQIPEIPVKDGFYSSWSRTDFSGLTSDETVSAIYERTVTLLSSPETRSSGLPAVLVEGNFRKEDTISSMQEPPASDAVDRWNLYLPDDGQTTHVIRYLPPDENMKPEDITIRLVGAADPGTAVTDTYGKYLTFEAEGDNVTFEALWHQKTILDRMGLGGLRRKLFFTAKLGGTGAAAGVSVEAIAVAAAAIAAVALTARIVYVRKRRRHHRRSNRS